LFKYERILGQMNGGAFVVVEFDDARDVGLRDEIRLKKAYDKFVDLSVNDAKKDLLIKDGIAVQYVGVGKTDGDAKMVVIYLHGRHGDRTLAQEDLRFGGNFNRIKNLMHRNNGAYLTPDFSNFGAKGTEEIKTLMRHYSRNSPDAPIVVTCASTGCLIVYRLLADPEALEMLDGVILHGALPVGSAQKRKFFNLDVFKDSSKHVPIYIGHASADSTVPWVTTEMFFKNVKKAAPGYPIRFELFKGPDAVHGTPIRMMDWRLVLNWILAANEAGAG
ncbi:MAG: alpha/beta hydrolase, partial [Hyphomicrobiales bacterium]|nr:alpha/beta hydrolase [Hyphomicrobiales bacterium]